MKNIPVIAIAEKTLAEAYEAAILAVYQKGTRFKTQYDKPEDPESMDCTMNITIEEPETDPMIHMAFPGGIEELKEYVMELKGVKDHWTKNLNKWDAHNKAVVLDAKNCNALAGLSPHRFCVSSWAGRICGTNTNLLALSCCRSTY